MKVLDDVRTRVRRFVKKAKNENAARRVKAESDISPDSGVAGSRANSDGDDGSYVGRTSPQFDAEDRQSGAEARSEAVRLSRGQR